MLIVTNHVGDSQGFGSSSSSKALPRHVYTYMCLWLLIRRCRLNPDRNAFRKLNLMEIRYSKEAYMVGPYYVLPSQLPREARLTYQSYDRIYRLSFHFLSYFTVEIKDP